MSLIAIYNVYDAEELLEGSVACIRPHVDCILAAVQTLSNHGERYDGGARVAFDLKQRGLIDLIANYQPVPVPPYQNEARKRLTAAQYAQAQGFTHFIHLDCDEYYVPAQFAAAKQRVLDENVDGSVASIKTYFKRPDWALEGLDDYYVPFIHRLAANLTPPSPGSYPYRC